MTWYDLSSVSSEELLSRLPAYKRQLPPPSEMTTEQLLAYAEYCRRNMVRRNEVTYDGNMVANILPELLHRLESVEERVRAACEKAWDEGYEADDTHPRPAPNPYKKGS